MNLVKIISLIKDKDSPVRKIMALNKPGTTKKEVLQVIMDFVHQNWITWLINSIHHQYEDQVMKLPPGQTIELRMLPDIERRQLKVLVEAVQGSERTTLHTIYTRDISPEYLQQQIITLMGGQQALDEPVDFNKLLNIK